MPRWLGQALKNRRSGDSKSVWNRLHAAQDIELTSPSFDDGGAMPIRFAAKGVGDNVSPALAWTGVPDAATHLVIVLEDLDVPFPRPLMHTVAVVPAGTTSLAEGGLAGDAVGVESVKGMMAAGYNGPRPIVGHGAHHYRFMLFAVDTKVDLSSQKTAIDSIDGHVLARGRIVGTYER